MPKAGQSTAERLLFLPGASGVASFWRPVMEALDLEAEKISFDYPGYGGNPPDPARDSIAKLTDWIDTYIDRPVDMLAQSMGGAIGLRLALRRNPMVRHLVLTGTTAGLRPETIDVDGARLEAPTEAGSLRDWLADEGVEISVRAANLPLPCLLMFGTQDPIAPAQRGRALQGLLPKARLVELETTSHFFVTEMADLVASRIGRFLLE